MSGHSSEEEAMDGLTIKPPQHVHHHHKDRKRDRSHRHPNKSRKDVPVQGGGGEDDDRRRHRHRHPHRSVEGRGQDVRGGQGQGQPRGERYVQEAEGHRSRSSNKKYLSGAEGPPGGERHSSSTSSHSQHHKSTSRSRRSDMEEEVVKIPRDKRAIELLETKLKRKHIELENERALREIERRRDKERGDESSSSSRRRRAHRQDLEKRQQQEQEQQLTPSPEDSKADSDLPEHVNIEIQEIEESSSELEEGEERSPLSPTHPPPPGSDKSDVSSASENEQERRDETKATSDVSSDTSSSRKSRSDDRSDVSSSSSSSGSESENENDKQNGETEPKPSKISRKDDSPPPSPIEMQSEDQDITEIPIDSKTNNGTSDIPTVIITEEEKEEELLPPYFPALQGCRRVEEFQLLNRIEEGTYGVVYRAKDKRTDEIVALKRLKMEKEKDGFPITSLREINTLLKAQHENIVTVREIVVGSNTDKIFLVMDYVEHDLKSLMETLKQKGQVFLPEEVKCLMIQLLRAVAHLHDNWILHRDLKTSNLLLSHKGILKVGDFGLAREYGSPLKNYTPIVVTLWYRAPELLLGTKEYSCPIDVWSVGCIFGELLKMEPMFPGKSEANQLNLIFQSLGTPNDRIWPGYTQMPLLQKMTFADYPVNKLKTRFGHLSEVGIDLMNKFLTFNPAKRFTAEEALDHAFFKEAPIPIDPSMFPTWPAKSEMGHRKAAASPKPPSGGQQFKGCKEDEDPAGFGFFLGGGDARRQPMGAGFSLKF